MFVDVGNVDNMYEEIKILKHRGHILYDKNGRWHYAKAKFRKINAPNDELKEEQKRILRDILEKIRISNRAYGFVKGKSICDNARVHLGAESILVIDLKNFFDTITQEQIHVALIRNRVDPDQAMYISKVCTRFGTAPQGAPTSPTIGNIVSKPMDNKIAELCKSNGCLYTRYADDITISGTSEKLKELKPLVVTIINSYGFMINYAKISIKAHVTRQDITGIVINKGTDISISKKKKLLPFRAKLHNIKKDIEQGVVNSFEELKDKYESINSLQGYANFIYQTNNSRKQYVDKVVEIRCLLKEKEAERLHTQEAL